MIPKVTIELVLESRPQMRINAMNETEEIRVTDWLRTSGYWNA